jgi:hypothetical protein
MMRPTRKWRRVLAGTLGALALASCVTKPVRLDAAKVVSGIELAPYSVYEECIALQPGDRIGYRFNVQPQVAFNVHFQEANAVILPVSVIRTSEESGDFVADRAQAYCLSWEAGADPAVLSYRVEPLPIRP